MKINIVIIILCHVHFLAHAFDSPTTIENLGSRLTDGQKHKINDFDLRLKNAKNDMKVQLILASDIYFNLLDAKIGIDLLRESYDQYGINPKKIPKKLLYNYRALVTEYFLGDNTPVDKKTAIKIFLELTKIFNESEFNILFPPILHNYFPQEEYLWNVWDNYKKGASPRSIDDVITEYQITELEYIDEEIIEKPDKKLFKACNNNFDKDDKILKNFQKIQAKFLVDGKVTKNDLTKAYKSLSLSNKINFQDNNISANTAIQLLVELIGDPVIQEVFPSDSLDTMISLNVKNSPAELVYQQILEVLNWDVFCYQKWIMLSNKSSDKSASRSMIFANFITKYELLDDKTVHITWDNGLIYQGGYQNGRPQGAGKYTYFENGEPKQIFEGNFEKGKLEGQGKEFKENYFGGGHSYEGEYHNGLYHGQGHNRLTQIDDSYKYKDYRSIYEQLDHKGQFINGQFQYPKLIEKYFVRDVTHPELNVYPVDFELQSENKKKLNNYILYKGPSIEGEPNGKGHCFLKELSYDCEFYKGYLIRFNGFSILPKNIILN